MNIKRSLAGVSTGVILFAITAIPAFASAEHLNWGSQINAGQCPKVGKPVVNVVQKVVNDVDSGLSGYWAFDTLSRQIQVWSTGNTDEYCAEVSYQGKFDAQAGQVSPGVTAGVLDGSEDGSFQGGYNATITGTLLSTPLWQTKGSVGTTDYGCDLVGNCPGYVSWTGQYFTPGYGFDYDWWGWIYHNGNNVWVNSSDGNSGDVL